MSIFSRTALKDKHLVFFGGGSGIGLASAIAAREFGARITIVGKDPHQLQAAAGKIGLAQTLTADIGDRKSIESAFEKMTDIDHLVLTAGRVHAGLLTETDPSQLLVEVNEHIAGSVYAVKAAIPRLKKTGSIVLMGGQFSDRPLGNGTSVMALASRGIEAFARSLALELKPVRVNVIAPGFVESPLYDAFGNDGRAELLKKAANALPTGRIGRPEEIADAILFLLSNEYMNCEVLHIDGGGRFV